MTVRVAINGLGRIGRATLKIVHETPELELVAVNNIAPPDDLAYLLKYDSVYGRFGEEVRHDGDHLVVGAERYKVLEEKDPAALPSRDMDVDLVFECTGIFTKQPELAAGSIADITMVTERATSVGELNGIFEEEAAGNRYSRVLGVTHDPIVSSDIIKDSHGSLVDLTMTQVVDGDLVKVMAWYDNEWGYAAQMVRHAKSMTAR